MSPAYRCRTCRGSGGGNKDLSDECTTKGTVCVCGTCCPKCPLRLTERTMFEGGPMGPGLYSDWLEFFDLGSAEFNAERPALEMMLGAVSSAVGALPEGQQIDRAWSLEFGAYVSAYQGEVAFQARERAYELTRK